MATQIEKNTRKLVEGKLDALFAKQQALNGNSKGQKEYAKGGELPKAWGGWGDPPYYGSALGFADRIQRRVPGGQGALQMIQDNYRPNLYGGTLPEVNVQSNAYRRNSMYNPITLPNTTVKGGYTWRPSANFNRFDGDNSGANPFAPLKTIDVPQGTRYTRPTSAPLVSGSTAGTPVAAKPFVQGPTTLDTTADYKYRPDTVSLDNVPSGSDYLTMGAALNAPSQMKFSNPKDDPNSPSFNSTQSKADTLKAAGVKKPVNWSKVGTMATQLAPVIYNLAKGLQKPDKAKPERNPYEAQIRSLMANRRFNIDPILNANLTGQAVMNRNIRNVGNSRGEIMSNLGAAQNARMTGDATAWAQKNNMDNQYAAEQAQMDYGLGSNEAQMNWMVQDANARNRAATNQFLGQGFNDLSKYSQTQQLIANQTKNSQDLARIFQDQFGGITGFMPEMQKILAQYNITPKATNG